MSYLRAVPKPVKREKKKAKGLQAKRWGVKHKARGTAHSRREREWGRMAFAHSWPCDVVGSLLAEFGIEGIDGVGPCAGRREYMHLHLEDDGGVRPPDHQGAIGCKHHHDCIDGREGERARRWYVRLGDDGQLRLKHRLVDRQRERWDALSWEKQAGWDARRGEPF